MFCSLPKKLQFSLRFSDFVLPSLFLYWPFADFTEVDS